MKYESEKFLKKSFMIGNRYGSLTVLEFSVKQINKRPVYFKCKCDCGTIRESVDSAHLLNGHTKSCGCYRDIRIKESKTKHGECGQRLYRIWSAMKRRCSTRVNHKDYAARGIKICDDWNRSFQNFAKWARENGYNEIRSIDRKDNNGDYEPSNCRWVTKIVQANNTRRNSLLTINGETKTVTQWAETTGIKPSTIRRRINLGWPKEMLFDKPNHKKLSTRIIGG